jgi:acyl carrier protein
MSEKLNEKVIKIAEKIFKVPKGSLNISTSAKDVEKWDSLSNIHFILALEEELKIKFKSSEVLILENIGQMIDLCSKKISEK